MGYACPVCDDPQADAEHLANHLAFTALLGDDDHEAWLDEHAPDWDQADADALAATVTELAEDTDYPQVFEDTTGQDHDHDRERSGALFDDGSRTIDDARDRARGLGDLDGEDEEILETAREMTRRMQEGGDESDGEAGRDADDSETE
jgi:hypothetical protein